MPNTRIGGGGGARRAAGQRGGDIKLSAREEKTYGIAANQALRNNRPVPTKSEWKQARDKRIGKHSQGIEQRNPTNQSNRSESREFQRDMDAGLKEAKAKTATLGNKIKLGARKAKLKMGVWGRNTWAKMKYNEFTGKSEPNLAKASRMIKNIQSQLKEKSAELEYAVGEKKSQLEGQISSLKNEEALLSLADTLTNAADNAGKAFKNFFNL